MKSVWLTLLILLLGLIEVAGQEFFMERVTTEEGLPANQILDIRQDSVGFLWLLSYRGVTRYDGTNFYHYPVEQLGNDQFTPTNALKLYSDPDGGIWTTTSAGAILSYDPVLDNFQVRNDSLTRLPGAAYSYYRDSTGVFWLGTAGSGLLKWDPAKTTVRQFQAREHPDSLAANLISSVSLLDNGFLYLTTTRGVSIMDPVQEKFYNLWFNASDGETYKHNVLRNMLETESHIYVSSYGGLHLIDKPTMNVTHLTAGSDSSTIIHNSLWEMAEGPQGHVWIASYGGGIHILDPETRQFRYLTMDNSALPENSVQGIFKDREGNLWFRMASSGLVKIDFRKQWVRHIDFTPHQWPAMTSGFIDADSTLWIATNGGGLIEFNLKTNEHRQYLHDPDDPSSLAYNHVTCLDMDKYGRLWLSTAGGGMDRFDPESGIFTHYPYAPEDRGVSNAALSAVYCSDDKVYYVTYGNGFGIYDQTSGSFESYQSGEDTGTDCDITQARVVMTDSQGNEWVSSDQGLIVRMKGDQAFRDVITNQTVEVPVSSLEITYLEEVTEGEFILINTAGELVWFYMEDENIRFGEVFSSQKRRIGNVVHIGDGKIWTVGNNSLVSIDMMTKKEQVFDQKDGLAGRELIYMTGKNMYPVMVPSLGGLNLLDLQNPPDTAIAPETILEHLTVLNRSVKIGDRDSVHGLVLERHLQLTDHITLGYAHKEFSLSFSALQFYAPGAASYRYRLTGFRDTWIETDGDRRVSYTNLDPGEYTFEVQASLFPGKWGPSKELGITITPPFWMTWWFISLVVLMIGLILYMLHTYRVQKAVAVANLRTQIAQDLHDDIGSTLTKISLYSSLIEEEEKETNFVGQIGALSREVITQMSDIVWSVDHRNDSMGDLVARMRQFAEETLSNCGMAVSFEKDISDERVTLNPLVRQNYYLIFKEAINNICKHSRANNVTVFLKQRHDKLFMEIADDGIGIGEFITNSEERKKNSRGGNGLGNMKKRADRIGVSFQLDTSTNTGTKIQIGQPT